jgi:hypothetical protein
MYRTEIGEEFTEGKAGLCLELWNNAKSREDFEVAGTLEYPFQIRFLGSNSEIVQNNCKLTLVDNDVPSWLSYLYSPAGALMV